MIEVALVFDNEGKTLHWHEPLGSTAGSIPDTRDLWDILWEGRSVIAGVAHTHPHYGEPSPSHIDLTTWAAIDKGLGRKLIWPIVTFDQSRTYAKVDGSWLYEPVWLAPDLQDIHELRIKSGVENGQ